MDVQEAGESLYVIYDTCIGFGVSNNLIAFHITVSRKEKIAWLWVVHMRKPNHELSKRLELSGWRAEKLELVRRRRVDEASEEIVIQCLDSLIKGGGDVSAKK